MDWNSTVYRHVCSCLPVRHCGDRFVHWCNLANNIGEEAKSTVGIMSIDMCILLLSFFLSLQHPNNSFENIYIFLNPPFNSVAQTLFLGRKNIGGGAFAPCVPQVIPVGVLTF
jgi:hypothetical protein